MPHIPVDAQDFDAVETDRIRGGVGQAGRTWDHSVFRVVPSWRASPWIEAFS